MTDKNPILMIHEIEERYFDLPLHDYILTFDDGLYSQYYYFDKFKEIDTEKIFFISTDIVASEDVEQSTEFPACQDAHNKFFNTRCTEDYMKWSQIREIDSTKNCSIGGHSHDHFPSARGCARPRQQVTSVGPLLKDTISMCTSFKHKLGYVPSKFCFPYNERAFLYEKILTQYGFEDFYGDERIAIEDL